MRPLGRAGIGLACVALLLLLPLASALGAPRPESTLRVFAAASLSDAFREIADQYENAHPGSAVQLNLAGSQQLASQLENGAMADVFAAADQRWMDYARERSLLTGEPVVFARNRLVVIVPRTNPARIARLQDLARRGVKLVIGAEAVPVGKYSRDVLANLSRTEGFESSYAGRVMANVVSEEENVKSVVGKVQLGEADAGIVYRSDVTSALVRYVRTFAIPDSANILASYWIAVVNGSRQPGPARDFLDLVLSPAGQRVLERRGLIPVASVSP